MGEIRIKRDVSDAIVYGIHIDPNIQDPSNAVTYLEDAVGMTPASMGSTAFNFGSWENVFFMPKPCMVRFDGTVDYYLDPNDYTKKADGTPSDIGNLAYQGNAMMEWGLLWFKFWSGSEEGEGYFCIADRKVDDTYDCTCNYDADGNITEHFYTAIYQGTTAPNYDSTKTYAVDDIVTYSDVEYKCITAVETAEAFDGTKWTQLSETTRLRSLSGVQLIPANGNGNTTGTQEVARATACNTTAKTEWYIETWCDRVLINALLVLIGKSLDTQGTFGRGIDSGAQAQKEAYVTGALNDKGLFYGSTANGTTAVKTFGMENWWALAWHRTAGLIGSANNTYLYKMTWSTHDGSTATGYNSNGSGYLSTSGRPASNYLYKAKYDKWGFLPIVTGSSSALYYKDYFYTGTSFALCGGSSAYNATSGAFFVRLSSAFGLPYWGIVAAPSFKPRAKTPYNPDWDNRPAHQYINGEWIDIPTHHYTNGRWQGELTSQSPLKFRADGEMLDWRIDGKTSENLFDINGEHISNSRLGITCFIVVDDKLVVQIISPGGTTRITYPNNFYNPNVLYTVSVKLTGELTGTRLLSTSPFPGGTYNTTYRAYWKAMTLNNGIYTTTFAPTETATIGFVVTGADDARNPGTVENIQLLEGSYTTDTLPPYEPYGGVGDWDETEQRYKIPVTVNGTTTNIYTDHQLMDGDSIDYETTQTAIPIATGNNTLTVDTAVQPSKVFVKFEG